MTSTQTTETFPVRAAWFGGPTGRGLVSLKEQLAKQNINIVCSFEKFSSMHRLPDVDVVLINSSQCDKPTRTVAEQRARDEGTPIVFATTSASVVAERVKLRGVVGTKPPSTVVVHSEPMVNRPLSPAMELEKRKKIEEGFKVLDSVPVPAGFSPEPVFRAARVPDAPAQVAAPTPSTGNVTERGMKQRRLILTLLDTGPVIEKDLRNALVEAGLADPDGYGGDVNSALRWLERGKWVRKERIDNPIKGRPPLNKWYLTGPVPSDAQIAAHAEGTKSSAALKSAEGRRRRARREQRKREREAQRESVIDPTSTVTEFRGSTQLEHVLTIERLTELEVTHKNVIDDVSVLATWLGKGIW
jgi:hypothetical protein